MMLNPMRRRNGGGTQRTTCSTNTKLQNKRVLILGFFALGFLHITFFQDIGTSNESIDTSQNPYPSQDLDVRNLAAKRRVAVVRPFSVNALGSIAHSFDSWSKYIPCSKWTRRKKEFRDFEFDVVLSFSQTYESVPEADKVTKTMMDDLNEANWYKCFHSIIRISNNIPADEDIYDQSQAATNIMWAHGPNKMFVENMKKLMEQGYEYALVMEEDTIPVRKYWLDRLMEEASKSDFAVIGSKYRGHAWDGFESTLSIALRQHFNGNALFNLKHPYVKELVLQLEREENTPLHAIGYDYRIAQIVLEGLDGTQPIVPPQILDNYDGELPNNSEHFRNLFLSYFMNESGQPTFRETSVVQNHAMSLVSKGNLLDPDVSLVHGGIHLKTWPKQKKLTLVVVIDEENKVNALINSNIVQKSTFAVSNLIVTVPRDYPMDLIRTELQSMKVTVPTHIHLRNDQNQLDLCEPIVGDGNFIILKAGEIEEKLPDLLYVTTHESKPIIANYDYHCNDSDTCRYTLDKVRRVYGADEERIVIKNNSVVFNAAAFNDFCVAWNFVIQAESNPSDKENLKSSPYIASAYIASLQKRKTLHDLYTVVGKHIKLTDERISHAARLLQDCSSYTDRKVCNAVSGCSFKKGLCVPDSPVSPPTLAPSCSTLSRKQCIDAEACFYDRDSRSCLNNVTRMLSPGNCSFYSDRKECKAVSGCTFKKGLCVPTIPVSPPTLAPSCSSLRRKQCIDAEACFYDRESRSCLDNVVQKLSLEE